MIQIVLTTRDILDRDHSRCGKDCPHLDHRMVYCDLYHDSCIGTPEDRGPEPVRCPSCVAAAVIDEVALGELRKAVGKP